MADIERARAALDICRKNYAAADEMYRVCEAKVVKAQTERESARRLVREAMNDVMHILMPEGWSPY